MSPINTGVRFKMFTSNGTFVVPEGVTKIYITAVGGGGAGYGSGLLAQATSTVIGSIVTLARGEAAASASPNGQDSIMGSGGVRSSGGTLTRSPDGYGSGGCATSVVSNQWGGTSGGCCYKLEASVTSGQSISITIGTGGTDASGAAGTAGRQGAALIEW